MAWLDDRIWAHPKVTDITDAAFRAWVYAIAYSSGFGTRGVLTHGQQRRIGATPKVRRQLLEFGLWEQHGDDGSIHIHDWEDHNSTRDERREKDRQRKRRERAAARAATNAQTADELGSNTRKTAKRPQDSPPDSPQDADEDAPQDVRALKVVKEEKKNNSSSNYNRRARGAAAEEEHEEPHGALLDALKAAGWSPAQLDRARSDVERASAWLDLARAEARDNVGGFAWSGFQSGAWPAREQGANGAHDLRPLLDVAEGLVRSWALQPAFDERELVLELADLEKRRHETIAQADAQRLLGLFRTMRSEHHVERAV